MSNVRGAVDEGITTGANTGLGWVVGMIDGPALYGVGGIVTTFGAVGVTGFGNALGSGFFGTIGIVGTTGGAGVEGTVGGITVEPQPPGVAAVAQPPAHTGVGSAQPSLWHKCENLSLILCRSMPGFQHTFAHGSHAVSTLQIGACFTHTGTGFTHTGSGFAHS